MTDTAGADTDFAIVPADVSDAGRYVQQAARTLINGIRSADTEVAGLIATWHGPAADAYSAAWDEARRGAVRILEALDGMGDLLGVSVDAVGSVDVDRAASTSSLELP
ncbi:WXG100 family type VII secretion target [Nocardia gipuzkoensis]